MKLIKSLLLVGLLLGIVGCGPTVSQVPADQAKILHTVHIDLNGSEINLRIIKVYGKCILYGYNVGMVEISPEGCL